VPRIYVQTLAVPAASIDANRHVNNLEYLRWMQDVATAHSVAQGWPLERYVGVGAGWFVRSHSIEYLRPAAEGDVLSILTWVADFSSSSSRRQYLFWRTTDRQIVAKAATLWVFVNFATGRPTRIPPELRSAFPVVPEHEDVIRGVGLGTQGPTAASALR
jgi:acyl-CoA thioester hydrolase